MNVDADLIDLDSFKNLKKDFLIKSLLRLIKSKKYIPSAEKSTLEISNPAVSATIEIFVLNPRR